MSSGRESEYEIILNGYRAKTKEFTHYAACGRPYILRSRLTQWLKCTDDFDHNNTPAKRLLKAAYRRRHEDEPIPISYESLTGGSNSCLLVFCILLLLDYGDLVHRFQREGKNDNALPIPLFTLRTILDGYREEANISEKDADRLAVRFNKIQWQFCPAAFEIGDPRNFGKDRVLPFCIRQKINSKGGTASLWQVEVLEEFVGLQLREKLPNSRYKSVSDNLGYRYQFALKSFDEGHRKTYENEKKAFLRLWKHKGMVRFLTEFEHKEVQGPQKNSSEITSGTEETQIKLKSTYNILLEFGECDLEEYFAQRLPPVFEQEIGAFWKGLFAVADALEGIHNLKDDSSGVVEEFHGWHADVKPENILSVQGKFKLADPGFAKFIVKRDEDPTAPVAGGTESYGAPERYSSGRQTKVTQKIDTWSLGCVFSIAATWVVLGCQGIGQFSILRQRAFEKATEGLPSDEAQQRPALPDGGDYFHDGKDVLPEVRGWHMVLRRAVRQTDSITSRVLDLVDGEMLIGNAEYRTKAKSLCEELKGICAQIEEDTSNMKAQDSIPKSVMEALFAVDKEAPSKFLEQAMPERGRLSAHLRFSSSDPRRDRSRTGIKLMKTSHRSETFESALSSGSGEDGAQEPQDDGQSNTKHLNQNDDPPDDVPSPECYRPSHKRTLSESHFQTISQAYEELNSQSWKVVGVKIKKAPKDPFLARHFDNRDIRFLIDNGETMKDFWNDAKKALETLLMKARGLDEDGMDLSFTSGPCHVDGRDGERQFVKMMNDKDAIPMDGMHTDMAKSLQDILEKYLRYTRQPYPGIKNLTLIVLTDGIWQGTLDKDQVRRVVVDFCESLEKIRGKSIRIERPVSIEFIQFGKDTDATARLRHLDDELKWDGVPDIIDMEHSSGNIYKMLLGSFVEGWDEEDIEAVSPTIANQMRTSPSPPQKSVQRMSSLHYNATFGVENPARSPYIFEPTSPRRVQTERSTRNNQTPTGPPVRRANDETT